MAKRDHDDLDRDDVEEAADIEDAEEADADADDAEPPEAEEAHEEEKPRPTPKVTGLTLTLCILNVAAALGFVFLLILDYGKRQSFTFEAAKGEIQLIGLGTKEEREGITAAIETLPRQKLSPEALKEAFTKRGGSSVSEPFAASEDGLRYQLYMGELPPDLVKELMGDLGSPVGSVDEEMARIKTTLGKDIEDVALQLAVSMSKADDAAKRAKVAMLLYPLCVNPMQVEKLEKKIKDAQPGGPLASLLQDAIQRRILADILLPVEMFRPSAPDKAILEKAADVDAVKLDDLLEQMTHRLDAAVAAKHDGSVHYGEEWGGVPRWTIEKRQNAAFLMMSIAYARNHLPGKANLEEQLLYPKGLERAQRISGLVDFTQACVNYNEAARKLEKRVLDALALDREGFFIQAGAEFKRSDGFADKHAAALGQIRAVQLQIRQALERVKDLQEQNDRAKKLVEERTDQQVKLEKRVVEERAVTKKRAEELRVLQKQLYQALAELATAADTNAGLEREIRRLSGVKGSEP